MYILIYGVCGEGASPGRLLKEFTGIILWYNYPTTGQEVNMGCLKGLTEVVLYVENMQEMVEFYRDAMGLFVTQPPGKNDFRREDWVVFDTGSCQLCLHSGGRRRIGLDSPSLVFRVNDLEVARDELTERGVPMEEPRMAAANVWVCDGEDPEGNRFSIQYIGQK